MTAVEQTDQEWEAQWWGDCANTFGEEAKQITYAHRMGLVNEPRLGKWPVYDLRGTSVVDLGGGPASMLLKTVGGWGCVVDPCPYPAWVGERYKAMGVHHYVEEAETWKNPYDAKLTECWIYNVLQHVVDPEKVIATARASAHTIRIFEWIEAGVSIGHPHSLRAGDLDRWLGGTGTYAHVDENGATGLAYWGTFTL